MDRSKRNAVIAAIVAIFFVGGVGLAALSNDKSSFSPVQESAADDASSFVQGTSSGTASSTASKEGLASATSSSSHSADKNSSSASSSSGSSSSPVASSAVQEAASSAGLEQVRAEAEGRQDAHPAEEQRESPSLPAGSLVQPQSSGTQPDSNTSSPNTDAAAQLSASSKAASSPQGTAGDDKKPESSGVPAASEPTSGHPANNGQSTSQPPVSSSAQAETASSAAREQSTSSENEEASSAVQPEPEKKWVEAVYKTVEHPEEGHEETVVHYFCRCGQPVDSVDGWKQHRADFIASNGGKCNGEHVNYYMEEETVYVVDREAWTEEVLVSEGHWE